MSGDSENGDLECICGHLESSHEQHDDITKPQPCGICDCTDFRPFNVEGI